MLIKKNITSILLMLLLSSCGGHKYKDGDIIFQRSQTTQSLAITLATKSPFTHVGIIYKKDDGKFYVFEAGPTVQYREIEEWIKSGKDGKYAIKRLKSDIKVTDKARSKMLEVGEIFTGREYDIFFDWSDDQMYCSELVYKVFKRGAGIKIGSLERLKGFDLTHDAVQAILKKRYGDKVPLEEIVISPQAMYYSPNLITVYSDFE